MMKKVVAIVVLIAAGSAAGLAQVKVKWYSIGEAIELAQTAPRVLVIDVYTDWCGWCKRMDASTFSNPEIAEIMNREFYPVKLNAEGKADIVLGDRTYKFVDNGRRGYHELAAIVTRSRLSYPTLAYVDAGGKILTVAPGYKGPDQLKVFLAYFSNETYKNTDWDSFSAAFASENTAD